MTPELLSALLALIGTLVGSFSGIMINAKLTNYRLEQLEKKVDKHNSVVERTFRLEERAELHEEKIKVVNHRLEDLERKED